MKFRPVNIAYLSILIYWGPSNGLTYAWGFIVFFILILFQPNWIIPRTRNNINIAICSIMFIAILIISFLANYAFQNSSLNNLLWTVITYGSSLCALIVFVNLPYRKEDYQSVLNFSLAVTLFEIALGYFQMIASKSFRTLNPFTLSAGAGDAFVGTTFGTGVGNEIAVKISIIALLFFPIWFAKKNFRNSTLLFLLILGWILASAIYTLLTGLLVIFLYFFLSKIVAASKTFRLSMSIFFSTAVGILVIVIFITLQPNNISYVRVLVTRAYNTALGNSTESHLGKVVYYKETLTNVIREYPHAMLIGLGPGNYSSRSAWLVSGAYLQNQPSYIPVTPSKAAIKYPLSIWRKENITEEFPDASSISYQPFSTWLSVFAEFGLVGLLSFGGIFYFLYRIVVKVFNKSVDPYSMGMAKGVEITLAYIVILFFFDNLFEWPLVMAQFFIFAGLLARQEDNWNGTQVIIGKELK